MKRKQFNRVTVRVPGSTSNCGAGFDTLGLALSIYNDITLSRGDWRGARAATDRDDAFPGPQPLRDDLAFQGAEVFLTVLDEDVADGLARALLDLGIGAQQVRVQASGQRLSDGGLARTGRTDEHRDRSCHALPT